MPSSPTVRGPENLCNQQMYCFSVLFVFLCWRGGVTSMPLRSTQSYAPQSFQQHAVILVVAKKYQGPSTQKLGVLSPCHQQHPPYRNPRDVTVACFCKLCQPTRVKAVTAHRLYLSMLSREYTVYRTFNTKLRDEVVFQPRLLVCVPFLPPPPC